MDCTYICRIYYIYTIYTHVYVYVNVYVYVYVHVCVYIYSIINTHRYHIYIYIKFHRYQISRMSGQIPYCRSQTHQRHLLAQLPLKTWEKWTTIARIYVLYIYMCICIYVYVYKYTYMFTYLCTWEVNEISELYH